MNTPPNDAHYSLVVQAIAKGKVVPLLGAGVNLCGRPTTWEVGHTLPNGSELAKYLAEEFFYPPNETLDLVRVSQFASIEMGPGPLYENLRRIFHVDYPPTSLHQFLARVPSVLRAKGYTSQHQLIVTTNYDDVLERAFRELNEPIDVVSYIAEGEHRGKFLHYPPRGEPIVIEKSNEYLDLSLDRRTVILKIHGDIDRTNSEWDSYVITEDHYIDYLTRTDIATLLPINLAVKLRRSHFLFLGYGLRDWNLRVILHRIWGEQKLSYKSWAIQLDPGELDCKFWKQREVGIYNAPLDDYIAEISARLDALPPKQP